MADEQERPELTGLSQLRRHLDRLRAAADLTPELLVQDLETVYEELRTSEEEVRVQQEQIARLVSDQASEHRQYERVLALLPVPVLTTDTLGVVRTANAAAAALLRVPGERLVGKPVFTAVSTDDRPALRRRVAEGVHGATREMVTVLRRDGSAVEVEVLITARPGPWPELCWVLLTADSRTEGQPGRERLTAGLMQLTGVLGSADDLTTLLTHAAGIVGDAVDDDASTSICVGSPLAPVAIGTTPGPAAAVDGAQIAAGDGPAMAAYSDDTTVVSADLPADARWPRLVRHLPDGAGSCVATPLRADGDVTGVLAVYLPGGRAAEVQPAVELLADTVAALVAELEAKSRLAVLAADLEKAMESRAVIEQAKGIIMAERRCDDEEAFAYLVRLSSNSHVKLRDLARSVVTQASGERSTGA